MISDFRSSEYLKKIAQSVHLKPQRRNLHVEPWFPDSLTRWKFQVLYELGQIHSAFVVASPERHWLVQNKQ